MVTGLFLRVRRGNYDTGTILSGTGAIAAALGSTILAGDELMEGNGQTRYGYANSNASAIVLTPQ